MNISKEELLRINRRFGGDLRSGSSIDYALEMQDNAKFGEYKKLAYLIRAIIVDHAFSDGNKRTAMYLALKFAEENKKEVDRDLLLYHLFSIAKNNINQTSKSKDFDGSQKSLISDVRNISDRMKNAIR